MVVHRLVQCTGLSGRRLAGQNQHHVRGRFTGQRDVQFVVVVASHVARQIEQMSIAFRVGQSDSTVHIEVERVPLGDRSGARRCGYAHRCAMQMNIAADRSCLHERARSRSSDVAHRFAINVFLARRAHRTTVLAAHARQPIGLPTVEAAAEAA